MKDSKMVARRLLVVLALSVWAGAAQAEPFGNPKFTEEVSKQTQIYESRGEAVPEGYVIGRSLLSYGNALASGFNRALGSLGAKDRWLDIGAGEGKAILDYCTAKYDVTLRQEGKPPGKAHAVAISIEDRRTNHWYQTAASFEGQLDYLFGKTFRDYSAEELGRFQLISDVMGGFSYTQNPAVYMEKALGLLDVGGSLYTVLQDVHSENVDNRPYYPDARFLTEIKNTDGSELKVCSWLKSIGCAQVTCEFKPDWTPPIEVYHVRKVCNDVAVPALVPTHFEAGTPPERGFLLKSSSSASMNQTTSAAR